jgi:hypothetical protein
MSRAITPRAWVALLVGAACGLSQADTPAPESASLSGNADTVLELALADGSVVRVPSDSVDKRAEVQALSDRGAAARRAVPRPRAPVFDAHQPGAIASVRG